MKLLNMIGQQGLPFRHQRSLKIAIRSLAIQILLSESPAK